jgi:amino acid transporter
VLIVYGAVLLSHALINHYGIRLVAWLNDFSVTVHIIGVILIVGALMFLAPKQPAGYFFHRVTSNTEGWPYWWAFIIGLLQAQWTFTGYDASAAVSEETVDPRRRAPWGMVMAVVVSSIVGYLLLIAITLAIKDIPSALGAKDASGESVPAVIAILQSALGERAGTVFSGLAAMAMWFCGLAAVTWNSRLIYAFSRDGGLPASRLWKRVSSKHLTPAPAIWGCVAVAFLAAVYSGAYAVVTSISVICLYFSYVIPVYLFRRGGGTALGRGPWHLGRYSAVINTFAIVWVAFISIVLGSYDGFKPGKTILSLIAVLGFWYLVAERKRFQGPQWGASSVDREKVTPVMAVQSEESDCP